MYWLIGYFTIMLFFVFLMLTGANLISWEMITGFFTFNNLRLVVMLGCVGYIVYKIGRLLK